jgi:prepilin-type N-terminal cleavage/methylation domain-containing protein
MKNKKKGFTLIELIVVVAVMGILAGIILVAMGPARKKGKDAKIISDLTQLQNRAEQIYLEKGNYEGVSIAMCGAWPCDSEILNLAEDIRSQGSSPSVFQSGDKSRYCAYSSSISSPTEALCVDYNGEIVVKRSVVETAAWCLSSSPNCPPSSMIIACADFNCDGMVTATDRDMVIRWSGTNLNGPVNSGGSDYDCDSNGNDIPDGQECEVMAPWTSIAIGTDVLAILGQIGLVCQASWCSEEACLADPSGCRCPQNPTGSCP